MLPRAALVLVDVQNDFLPPSGSLAVPFGNDIIPAVLQLLAYPFELVIASQDYHPPGHISFASSHAASGNEIQIRHPVSGLAQTQELWPDHCVQATPGAELEGRVAKKFAEWMTRGKAKLVRKGEDKGLDAYSAFAKPLRILTEEKHTACQIRSPLSAILEDAEISKVVVVGLATDFCVKATVLSALAESSKLPETKRWEVIVVKEGVRAVNTTDQTQVLDHLREAGACIVSVDGPELDCLRDL